MLLLLVAVGAGLLAGLVRARAAGRHLEPPHLRLAWLVPVAFLPQWLAFHWAVTRGWVGDGLAAAALVGSQALLLLFVGLNWSQPGFWILGLGLALNLLVIVLNGGLMPVSPETLAQLLRDGAPRTWQVGDRLGWSTVLPVDATRLWWLSDQILLPDWFPYRKAFSVGDILVAAGAFWLLWTLGEDKTHSRKKELLR